MNHPPKQLALLISLIGGGISPYAQARIAEQRVDLLRTLPDIVCTELDAAALPACAAQSNRDLVWQPQRSALDLGATAGVLVLYGGRSDDWAPGESPGASALQSASPPPPSREPIAPTTAAAAPRPGAATEAPRAQTAQTARKHAGKTRRMRVLAKAAVAQIGGFAKADAQAIERVAPIERIERIEHWSSPMSRAPAPASAGSIEVERLLANLVMVLGDAPAPAQLAPAEGVSLDVEREPSIAARLLAANAPRREVPPITVETQADRVLRSLGAIVSEPHDPAGATRSRSPQPTVTSHSAKVMAMLGQLSSAAAPVAEDGPARRLRKLAARAAKAQATADAARREAAESGVDVLLPIGPPTFAALLAEPFVRLPRIAVQPRPTPVADSRRASPFGDTKVAISESSLDRVRGGYAGEGLNISFGIERAVYINGSLVTTTTLNVTDLGQITAGRGAVSLDTGTVALIQNGAGNSVAGASISSSAMGTIVQNTLDGQKIQNVTVINATANSLGLYRTLNLQSSMRGAVIDSLRR